MFCESPHVLCGRNKSSRLSWRRRENERRREWRLCFCRVKKRGSSKTRMESPYRLWVREKKDEISNVKNTRQLWVHKNGRAADLGFAKTNIMRELSFIHSFNGVSWLQNSWPPPSPR